MATTLASSGALCLPRPTPRRNEAACESGIALWISRTLREMSRQYVCGLTRTPAISS